MTSNTEIVEFATKLMQLIEEGRTTTTYKYALLMALIELSQENVGRLNGPAGSVTSRQVAERVIEIYWPHVLVNLGGTRLRQINTQSQFTIVDSIADFREKAGLPRSLNKARTLEPDLYVSLVDNIERTLCRYPIPLLQQIGGRSEPLLYDWPKNGYRKNFDNRLCFKPNVEVKLAILAPLIKPLLQREWTRFIQLCNKSPDELDLQSLLFDPIREDLSPVGPYLKEYQQERCFYCGDRLQKKVEVDHFIPWSKSANNALENLVVAHPKCNRYKQAHLAGLRFLSRWRQRFINPTTLDPALQSIVVEQSWVSDPPRTLRIARALYISRKSFLWVGLNKFEKATIEKINDILDIS